MLQLGIGTFKKTNLIIRYTPSITYNEFKTSMFGLGIKHDIMQWFPGLKRVPIDVAVLAGLVASTIAWICHNSNLKEAARWVSFL
jgi:hypothetical protein